MNHLRAIFSILLARKRLLLGLGVLWLALAAGWIWHLNTAKDPIVGLWLGKELNSSGEWRRVRFEAHPGGTFRLASSSGKTTKGTWRSSQGWSWKDRPVRVLNHHMVENYPYWQNLRAKGSLILLPHVYELTAGGESWLVAVQEDNFLVMGDSFHWTRAKPLRQWLGEAASAISKGEKIPPRDPPL